MPCQSFSHDQNPDTCAAESSNDLKKRLQVYYAPNNVGCLTNCMGCSEPFKPYIDEECPFDAQTRMPVCLDCAGVAETIRDPFIARHEASGAV
jgi:hypothetical protein